MKKNCFQKTASLISHLLYLKCKTRTRFTLIELLIVVAIIAILASILLPALTAALNKARTVHCLSNMKQLGLASQNYLDTYNDTITMMKSDWTKVYYLDSTKNYVDLSIIAREATGLKEPVCKKDTTNTGSHPWVPQKYVCSVVSQQRQHGYASLNDSNLKDVSLCSFDTSCSGHLQYFFYYGILIGSRCVLTDSNNNWYHKTSRLRQASGSVFWGEGSEQLIISGPLRVLSNFNEKSGYRRHSGRTSVLFFDGHAGLVGDNQTVCNHNPLDLKNCASCRFWVPYMK